MSKKILLIAGHGAGDPGAVSGGHTEEKITRELVKKMCAIDPTLDHYDYNRNCFADNGLARYALAEKYDEIVEFHLDSSGRGTATGGHTIIHSSFRPDETDNAVQAVVNKHVGTFKAHASNGGFSFRNNLLNLNVAATVGYASYRLVELGFIDNVTDRSKILNNLDKIANDFVVALRGEIKTELKPLKEVAREVRLGRWGNGKERVDRLTKAGYKAPEVQAEVDRQKKKYYNIYII